MAKIVTKDNGYFEIWQRACGHHVRVTTEDTQWARRHGDRARLTAATRDRLDAGMCRECED